MNKGTEELIKNIRQLFEKYSSDYYTINDMWNVLSGLRGPDSASDIQKDATTALIRKAVLGDICIPIGIIIKDTDSKEYVKTRRNMRTTHFQNHAYRAFHALDLDWYSDNGEIKCTQKQKN